MRRWAIPAVAAAALGLFLLNTSLLASPRDERSVLAHRGVHHTYDRTGVKRDDCTATRIYPPTHALIENTIPSIRAALAAGANAIEIDIHPTTDGEFAVFHDWTVDCRTDGEGVTREQTMTQLRTLDVGYGYTADGGATFPLRGKGIGLMPTLGEVLESFPDVRFLLNIKSNDPEEADALNTYLSARTFVNPQRLSVFGGERPVARLKTLRPDIPASSRASLKTCAKDYMLLGWTGFVPASCRGTVMYAPVDWAWVVWGYPNRFLTRMQSVNTRVFLVGPVGRNFNAMPGVDDERAAALVPRNWRGGVVTDRIEVVGPLLLRRPAEP